MDLFQHGRELTGEQLLWMTVMGDALREGALGWLRTEPFEALCASLNWDPDAVRQAVGRGNPRRFLEILRVRPISQPMMKAAARGF